MDTTQIPSTGIHWLDVTLYVIGCVSAVATAAASLPFVPAKVAGPLAKIGVHYIPALFSLIGGLFRKKDPNALTPTEVVTPTGTAEEGKVIGEAGASASRNAGPKR